MRKYFENRDNRPLFIFIVLLSTLLFSLYFLSKFNLDLFNGRQFFSSAPNIIERVNAIYSPNVGKIKLSIFIGWFAIVGNWVAIIYFYNAIMKVEKSFNLKVILIIITLIAPYLSLLIIWFKQSEEYKLYYINYTKLNALKKKGILSKEEMNEKLKVVQAEMISSINQKKEEKIRANDINEQNAIIEKLNSLKESGIITEDEYNQKIEKLKNNTQNI